MNSTKPLFLSSLVILTQSGCCTRPAVEPHPPASQRQKLMTTKIVVGDRIFDATLDEQKQLQVQFASSMGFELATMKLGESLNSEMLAQVESGEMCFADAAIVGNARDLPPHISFSIEDFRIDQVQFVFLEGLDASPTTYLTNGSCTDLQMECAGGAFIPPKKPVLTRCEELEGFLKSCSIGQKWDKTCGCCGSERSSPSDCASFCAS